MESARGHAARRILAQVDGYVSTREAMLRQGTDFWDGAHPGYRAIVAEELRFWKRVQAMAVRQLASATERGATDEAIDRQAAQPDAARADS